MSPTLDPEGEERWARTFDHLDPAALAAAQASRDEDHVRRLLKTVDEPTCYVPYCGAATVVALCPDPAGAQFVIYACDTHQARVVNLRRIRCPWCGRKGAPTDLLRWQPVFVRRCRP